jgi:putative MFS transporter
MLAFFVVMLADRLGRKPVVSITVLLYTLFTLATALSRGLGTFTLFQSCAQIFLSAEFGVAIIIISEEFPDNLRGRGIAAIHMIGLIGVVAAGALYGYVVDSSWGWRGMYLIGIVPLLLVAFLRRNLKETRRFEAHRIEQEERGVQRPRLRAQLATAFAPFAGPYRGRLLLVAVLWNCVGLVGAPAVTFFSLYAKRDHHWTSAQVGHAVVLSYVIGTLGHLLCGYLLDKAGRRLTTAAFYIVGAFAMWALFHSSEHSTMLSFMVATVFAFQGARTATSTYSTELFPTEIRATSYSWTVQVLGQIAALFTPVTIGVLSKSLGGLSNAVSVVCVGPLIGALAIALWAPETRGKKLEELVLEPIGEPEIS